MHIEINKLPTHMAQVGRRLNIVSPDDVAATFLEASYLAEVAIKTITLVFLAGVRDRIPDHAYRFSHGLVRADGLGTWEAAIRELVSHPLAGFLPPEFQQMLAWAIKRRTKPEDAWFQDARTATANVLQELGSDAEETTRGQTVKELITALVQIRNKTKAHGAVGADFYSAANIHYIAAVRALIANCPAFQWQWMHLMKRDNASIRGVLLQGDNPRHMTAAELAAFTTSSPGVYFVPERPTQIVHVPRIVGCFELLKTTRECTSFLLPNGGFTSNGEAEFIDYATGKTSKENVSAFLSPPVPLPASETEGAPALDVQSNAFGNLPILPNGYVERKLLQDELTRRLLDKNHPTITLHGMGGVGKTSLALFTAHNLASAATPHFDFIVWFSARDVDLRPSGPSSVRPSVVDVNAVSKAFGSLFGVDPTIESFAKVLQSPKQHTDKGILFIFDNFETMSDVTGVHKFLDEHTHLPNKVLITSRERAFVADFPIEVRSMEYNEATQMLHTVARELSIESLVTDEVIRGIYQHTGGHAYVMRVVLGEMAKEGRYMPPKQLIPRRMDIVDAVFERSFNKLSDAGRSVFLTVANWKSEIAELALIVVLGQRGLDVEAGIDECKRLSLILPHEMVDQQPCYSAPQLARVFASKKLQGDADRLIIQGDLETLRKFGVIDKSRLEQQTQDDLVLQFINYCLNEASGKNADVISHLDKIMESVANLWPRGWLHLVNFRQNYQADSKTISYALRRAVEEEPFNKKAWLERAHFAGTTHDDATRIASLVSAVDADPGDVELIREVAFQLSQYVNAHIHEIPKARRGVYLASVRAHMEKVASALDATALSRLAWLFLLEENVEKARKYADLGCAKDPVNKYCLGILERLENQIT